jgi:Zn finger protein HypA/HybF involved in hydrogenase expression
MDKRQRAVELFTQGLTYAAIGKDIGVSRQYVQQLVRPPKAIYDTVKSNADGKCEDCGIYVARGHVHHRATKGTTPDNFNELRNLEYLCPSCHRKAHEGLTEEQRNQKKHGFERCPNCHSSQTILNRKNGIIRCRRCSHSWQAKQAT